MTRLKRAGIGLGVGAAIFLALMYWYQWSASPLKQPEIEDYLARIEAQTQVPGGRHDMVALRDFLESDDGQPVYVVNQYAFHDVADYPAGSGFGGTGEEAFARFQAIMLRLTLARASHPVFSTRWIHEFNTPWERMVIMRYRSRRDLVDIFATDKFASASLHKWAALREHGRFQAKGGQVPSGLVVSVFLALISGLIAAWIAAVVAERKARG